MRFIKNLRHYGHPTLAEVNGLLNFQVMVFAIFNVILGSLMLLFPRAITSFYIVTPMFTPEVWAGAFMAGGLMLAWSRFLNYWTLGRLTMLFLLTLKFIWLTALVIDLVMDQGTSTFFVLFFGLVAALQAGAYIYFPIFSKVETWKD